MRTLKPDSGRGELFGAAAVALTLTVVTLNARFAGDWGRGIHLVYTAAAAAFVIVAAMSADRGEGKPPVWHSVLFVTGFVLAAITLARVADILGSDGGSGTYVWVGLLLIGLTTAFANKFDSGISTLLGALTAIAVVVALIDLLFHPHGAGTFRWILLLLVLAFAGGSQVRRASAPDHANGYVNAAGIALLVIAFSFVGESLRGIFGGVSDLDAGAGWELLILLGAAALAAYTVAERRSGAGYLAAANFGAFLVLAAGPGKDGPSLIGWPIVLVLVTAALLGASLAGNRSPG